jgi:hypothetical protein
LRRNSLNIAFLAAIQLGIFLTPLIIKDTHYHSELKNITAENAGSKSLSSADKQCLICRFEINNLISTEPLSPGIPFPANLIATSPDTRQPFRSFFIFYSDRAPPSTFLPAGQA